MSNERDNDLDDQAERLKAALRRLPGPVSLVTAFDVANAPAGMVASAVIPVSMEPPSMLVSVNRSASMHSIIIGAGTFCINLLGIDQRAFVNAFSSHSLRDKRFDTGEWQYDASAPYLPDACASIFCKLRDTKLFGTHELFIGEVSRVIGTDDTTNAPLGWMEGDFARFGSLD
ncbi:MAG: flavin reductase family protein [Pontixanthobacter sp.]